MRKKSALVILGSMALAGTAARAAEGTPAAAPPAEPVNVVSAPTAAKQRKPVAGPRPRLRRRLHGGHDRSLLHQRGCRLSDRLPEPERGHSHAGVADAVHPGRTGRGRPILALRMPSAFDRGVPCAT